MNKRVLVPLAAGFEELEAVTIIDLLRRAGVEVIAASLTDDLLVKASRGVVIQADAILSSVVDAPFDLIVLPGGMPGSKHLHDDTRIISLLQRHYAAGGWVAAICAAPMVLLKAGLLDGQSVTAYPGVLSATDVRFKYVGSAVEIAERVITSRGPGTAMDFSLQLIQLLMGQQQTDQVASALVR